MGDMIVEQWLRPLNLQHYTQAFLDNGYDDLEVCKQIGEPDLDAIGVLDLEHRKRILDAVEALRKEGESAVYFTLENPDYECYACNQQRSNVDPGAAAGRQDPQPYLSRRSFFTYPRLQLMALLQERLFEDDVRLAERPYTDENGELDAETLQHLASCYADQLNVPIKDVLDRLEELQMAALCPDASHSSEAELEPESPGRGPYSMISVYGQSPRSAPPPLPPLSSMSCLYVDPIELEQNIEENGSPNRIPRHSLTPSTSTDPSNTGSEFGSATSESSVKESVGNTLGRLFRSVTLRRPVKKFTYHQHQGDLNASEIMMSEDERIQLMVLVKEGKLSIDEAVETVKNHRREHRPAEDGDAVRHDPKSSSPPSSTDSVKSESSSGYRDGRSKVVFGSHFSRWKGGATKESERSAHCFIPLLHRKKSKAFEPTESPPKMKSYVWSPPPLPPIPRNSGIIVESVSAECMARYKSSSLKCSPLLANKNGNVRPTLPVRKSRSLHSSVPPEMAPNCSDENCDDSTLRMRSHHYENVRRSDGADLARMLDISQNGVSFNPNRKTELGEDWECWAVGENEKEDLDGTLTNTAQRICVDTAPSSDHYLHKDGIRIKGQNGHRSRTRRRHLKDREEPVNSSNDSLTNAIASGACGVSSSSSHSSMSTEEELISKLAYVNQVRAKVDYIPSPGDDLETLTLKKGDIIYLLSMVDSRWCRGILNNQIGTFRSTDVEPVGEDGARLITPRHMRPNKGRLRQQRRPKPKTIEELLHRLGLQYLANLFLQHGFHTLDDFSELDEIDLNELDITSPEERVKLLTAAQLLLDSGQNEFDSCSRSASQSPALSHDASSQTVLTHFCARDRSVVASTSNGLPGTPPSMSQAPRTSSVERSGMRYPSETSSDDQEILSITKNGAIVLSWRESNVASFVEPNSSAKVQPPPGSGVSLSDSSISSGGDHFVGDLASANNRRSKCSPTSTQTGLRLPTDSGRQCSSETQTIRCPDVALFGKVPVDEMLCGEHDDRKRCESAPENNGSSNATSGDVFVPSTSSNDSNTVYRKSSPFMVNGPGLVAVKVGAVPSVKTAHVRHLVTASPLHSPNPHVADSDSLGNTPSVFHDEDRPQVHRQNQRQAELAEQNTPSLQDLLGQLGLSEYVDEFNCCGVTTSDQFKRLDEAKLQIIGIRNRHHIQLLVKTIDSLKHEDIQTSFLTDVGFELPVHDLENVAQTQDVPSSSVTTNLWNSRIVSKASSTDSNFASSKARVPKRQSKIVDRV